MHTHAHTDLPFSSELSMIVVGGVSRNLPSPERHSHNGVCDGHDQQRQQVDQNDDYDMIPWKECRALRITIDSFEINQRA